MSDKSKRSGRPAGNPSNPPPVVTVHESRCPTCQSTARTPYFAKTEQLFSGVHDGQEFTHIIRRRTQCSDCGQARIDRTFENRDAADPGEMGA